MPKKNGRILIKISGERMGDENYGIDLQTVQKLAMNLILLKKLNIQICLVIGGGNILRPCCISHGDGKSRCRLYGNVGYSYEQFSSSKCTRKQWNRNQSNVCISIQSICETYIRRRNEHMEKGRIVICAAGTGNPYFSTDTAAALRAAELKCNTIYKATKVDGIYIKILKTPR